ncbi:MAG TPA: sigma-70 family RNA polymerase sigma factor [Acidobacteriaceae bacterium]|nr:sigma-70 family RNA polymerase sigma factor [Acidobacteriaceae bacterium]
MAVLSWRRKDDAAREGVRAEAEVRARFEALALPLLPSLYNTARWLTRDAAEAEDLVQETMVKALGGFAGFEAGTNFKAWAFRILRNTYLTSRSGLAARRTVALEEELEAGGVPETAVEWASPELELMRLSDRAALERAMEELPPPLKEVVLLCDVEEMKYREIAAVLEVPIGTVMSRVSRARAVLREKLTAEGTRAGGSLR